MYMYLYYIQMLGLTYYCRLQFTLLHIDLEHMSCVSFQAPRGSCVLDLMSSEAFEILSFMVYILKYIN